MKPSTYERLMQLGKSSGCHQMPERSFFCKERQFPVCARCTGVFIGQITAYILFFIYIPPLDICAVGCAIMFIDWFVQFMGWLNSNNIRRLITGIIGGYSTATVFCTLIKHTEEYIIHLLINV